MIILLTLLSFSLDFSVGMIVALSQGDNGNSSSRRKCCIVGSDLTKLLAEADTRLLLISCQKSHQARYTTPSKRHQNQHTHPAVWDFVNWFQRYASTIICRSYCCTDGSTSSGYYGYPIVIPRECYEMLPAELYIRVCSVSFWTEMLRETCRYLWYNFMLAWMELRISCMLLLPQHDTV
jgi:hypothetical protein